MDFRDLNEACLKDDFPLPVTELMIDSTSGHEALSFIDTQVTIKFRWHQKIRRPQLFAHLKASFAIK